MENLPLDRTIISERTFPVTRERLFRAWTASEEIRLWWGPDGFSNHFFVHDVRPGGEWRFLMRGPDGKEYPNHSQFTLLRPNERIEFDHFGPDFHTTVLFKETAAGTHLRWAMEFPTVRDYTAISAFAIEGNRQNLERLHAFLKSPPLVVEKVVDAPVPVVWTALTEPSVMKQWYFDLPGFRAEKGYAFEFNGGPPEKMYRHCCEVTDVIPQKRLAYTWRYDGYPGNSLVTFELFGEGERTTVRVHHAGLETFPGDQPAFARGNFETGWKQIVGVSLAAQCGKKRDSERCITVENIHHQRKEPPMAAINVYLNFPGNTEEAFNFYRSVFGGQFTSLVRFSEMPFGAAMSADERQKLMHVALPAGGMTLMGTDALASQGHTVTMGTNVSLMLAAESIEESDQLFAALSAGGKVETPMDRSPWGAYYGAFTDKFGIRWMVNCDLK